MHANHSKCQKDRFAVYYTSVLILRLLRLGSVVQLKGPMGPKHGSHSYANMPMGQPHFTQNYKDPVETATA